jgi:hypothetical protein
MNTYANYFLMNKMYKYFSLLFYHSNNKIMKKEKQKRKDENNTKDTEKNDKNIQKRKFVKKIDDIENQCEYCEKVFSQKIKLKEHLENCKSKEFHDKELLIENIANIKLYEFPEWFQITKLPKTKIKWENVFWDAKHKSEKNKKLRHLLRKSRQSIFKHIVGHANDVGYIFKFSLSRPLTRGEQYKILYVLKWELKHLNWIVQLDIDDPIIYISAYPISKSIYSISKYDIANVDALKLKHTLDSITEKKL